MMLCMRWVLTSLLFVACGDDKSPPEPPSDDPVQQDTGVSGVQQDTGTDEAPVDCDLPDGFNWDNWGRPFFRTWCAGCHAADAPNRFGAPEWLVFDTEAQVYGHRAIIRSSVLETKSMPLGGGLPPEDSELLDLYLRCVFGA